MDKISCLETLKESSYVLFKSGILFIEKITIFDMLKIVSNFTFSIFMNMLVILNIQNAMSDNNMRLANWMVCVLIPMLYYTAKQTTLLINKKCVSSLLNDLNSDIFNNHAKNLNRHIGIIKSMSSLMLRYFGFAAVIFVVILGVLPLAINVRAMIPPPFDTGRYELLYKLFHLISITYLGINAVCMDIFLMTLMALAIGQLNILLERLVNVLRNANEYCITGSSNVSLSKTTFRIVNSCIVQHQMIILFIEKLNLLSSFPLLVQYTCGCFTICNTILRLTIMGETDINSVISNISYSSIMFAEMTVYHVLGNAIIYKSDKIVESCYLSDWYKMNISCQKSLLVLMERARRPLIIKLYKFIDISLNSFGVIVRWSYSIFALIKANYG